MNILICGHPSVLWNRIDTNYYDMFNHISQQDTVYIVGLKSDKIPKNVKFDMAYIVDVGIISPHDMSILQYLKYQKIPIVLFTEDIYYIEKYKRNAPLKSCIGLVNTVQAPHIMCEFITTFPNLKIHTLQSTYINTTKFNDYELEKKYDILFYGVNSVKVNKNINNYDIEYYNNNPEASNEFYPLRDRLYKLLEKWNRMGILNVKFLTNKYNYFNKKSTVSGSELSKIINQCYLSVATRTRQNIMVKKYLEIAASNSVILGNIPMAYETLFKDNIIEVNMSDSDDYILNVIQLALTDKKNLLDLGKSFGKKIRDKYNYSVAHTDFINISKAILDK